MIYSNTYKKCKLCGSRILNINTEYNLVQCANCDLIFSKTIYTEQQIIQVYDKLYNKSDIYIKHQHESILLSQNKNLHLGHSKQLILKTLINHGADSFLEIGAGVGIVGQYLSKRAYKYVGIELDSITAQKARSIGINIINSSFESMINIPGQFDAIIAFEVIEHLQDLNLFFRLTEQKLNSKGLLAFTVPNFNKIKNYEDSKLHQDPPPIHLNFFTYDNIKKILNNYNWDIVDLKVRKWPYLNLKNINTYRFISLALIGKYEGPTILCIARKRL